MAEKNGNGFSQRIIMYLVGVIVSLVIFVAIPTMANNMINNDKDSRSRDGTMRADFNDHVVQAQKTFAQYTLKQESHNGEIKSLLTGLAKDIQYNED